MILGIIIGLVAIVVAICAIVGLYKGFSGTRSWAVEYLLTAVITLAAYSVVDLGDNMLNLCCSLGTAILLLLVFAFISKLIRGSLKRKIEGDQQYSHYETYEEREQLELEMKDAAERGDKELYEELSKRKIKEKTSATGVADRLFGAINMLVKGFVASVLIVITVLFLLQCTQLSFVQSGGALYSIYTSSVWEFISPYILDLLVIFVLQIAIRAGYRWGIVNGLFILVVLALIVGAGYLAYVLAFTSDAFISLTSGASSQLFAQIIVMAVVFVIEFVIILVLALIVGNALSNAREAKTMSVIDGVFGAIIFMAIALAILLFGGMLLYALHSFEVMSVLNSYSNSSVLFSCLYNNNPLNGVTAFADFQSTIAGLFGN